jgi:ABC-2 type transport system permease protein
MAVGPIADLSYRDYDGPLEAPGHRWWVIARMSIRLAFKKKSYWILTGFSGIYLVLVMVMIFFFEQFAAAGGQGETQLRGFVSRIVWKDQFLHAFSFGQMWFLFLALLLGAGSIANDNRANALLVYLSKPCSKTDYLVGKWMGIFLPLCISMAIPSLFFWLYGALSYREYGFLSNDPWMIFKVGFLIPIEAGFYASLVILFSSLVKTGRVAGATLAGLFFLTNFFTKLMAVPWALAQNLGPGGGDSGEFTNVLPVIEKLFYASVDGLGIGVAKAVLGTDGSLPFNIPAPFKPVPAPWLFGIIPLILTISALCVWIAWKRIRAVEVVG